MRHELLLDHLAPLLQLVLKCDLDHILHVVELALEVFEFLIAFIYRLLKKVSEASNVPSYLDTERLDQFSQLRRSPVARSTSKLAALARYGLECSVGAHLKASGIPFPEVPCA